MLDIPRSVEAELKRCIQVNNWDEFEVIFNDLVMGHKGDVFLTFEEPAVGKTIPLTRITTNELKTLRNHDVENTLLPESLNRWLGPS